VMVVVVGGIFDIGQGFISKGMTLWVAAFGLIVAVLAGAEFIKKRSLISAAGLALGGWVILWALQHPADVQKNINDDVQQIQGDGGGGTVVNMIPVPGPHGQGVVTWSVER
jgi:hypothetical protein